MDDGDRPGDDRSSDARVSLWTVAAVVLVGAGLAIGWSVSGLLIDRYHTFLDGLFSTVDREDPTISRSPLTAEGLFLLLLCSAPLVGYVVAWVVWAVRSPAVGRFRDIWKLFLAGVLVALFPVVLFMSIGEWLLIDA